MRIADVREIALALPGTSEEPHFEKTSFRVGKKIFATVPSGEEVLHVFVDAEESRACVAQDPETFEELWWGKKLMGLRVVLEGVNAEHVRELLDEAWRRKAPKRLIWHGSRD
jgi:hypothetical protein